MRRNSPAQGGLCLAAFFCLSGTPAPRGVPGSYQIIDLGTLGGLSSVALGINNLGQVVGGADLADGFRHAFLWSNGVMTDLGTLGADKYSEAWDINNLGAVCGGSSFSASSWRAFVWQGGVMTQLAHLGGMSGGDSFAFALNDSGQAVGTSNEFPVLWENGSVTDLFTTYGLGFTWDITNNHLVPGGRFLLDLTTGMVTNLGTLGGNFTGAMGANPTGQVTGASERDPGAARFHAFFWQSGTMTDLSILGGFDGSSAEAINASGHVVGNGWWFGNPIGYPFLYVPGFGLRNLENMIPIDSGWSSLVPRDINDAGQIVGYGVINEAPRAFLMTPAPVPAVGGWGLVVLATAIVGLAARLVRRGGALSTSWVVFDHYLSRCKGCLFPGVC